VGQHNKKGGITFGAALVIIVQIFVRIPYNEISPNIILYILHELANIKRVYNQQIAVLETGNIYAYFGYCQGVPVLTALLYSFALCRR